MTTERSLPYNSDDDRWRAVVERDAGAEGCFWFSVATTGVYCYPSCAARRPRRENVAFHATREAAQEAGFRPCKRCRPELPPRRVRHADAVARACALLDACDEAPPTLEELADEVQMSPYHFHRVFKKHTGITPKQYGAARRAERMRERLADGGSVTDAIYDAGFSSASRFYEKSQEMLGMAPAAYARGGRGETIRWGVATCWLGYVLVAATERGVCAILLGDSRAELSEDLAGRFPRATLEEAAKDSDFTAWVDRTVAFLRDPGGQLDVPLDVAGTAFQQQVWAALREVRAGETASYAEVANRIGKPHAARAVAQACAANPVAVAIPCHRVVRSDGSVSGYRWGEERKRALLRRESGT